MDPVRRRFEHFTSNELKSLRQGMVCYRVYNPTYEALDGTISVSKMGDLIHEINNELGDRFNELQQEGDYV